MVPDFDLPGELIADGRDLSLSALRVLMDRVSSVQSTYIASTTRVPVLEPRSSDIVVFFIYSHFQVLHRFLGLLQEVDGRRTSSHEDYAYLASRSEWFFTDPVASRVDFRDMKAITLGGDMVELIDMVTGSGGVIRTVVFYHHRESRYDVKVC